MLLWTTLALAQTPEPRFDLAQRLEEAGMEQAAAVELLRQASVTEGEEGQRLELAAAVVLLRADDLFAGTGLLEGMEDRPPVRLASAWAAGRSGDHDAALVELVGVDLPDAAYLRAWSHLQLDQQSEALAALDSSSLGPLQPTATQLAGTVRAWEPLPRRSPGLAVGLSAVIPGAGQVYAGAPVQGAGSFLLHALAGVGAWWLVSQEQWVWAGVVGGVGGILYLNNLGDAWVRARRFQERRRQERMDDLVEEYEPGLELDDSLHLVVP